LGVDSEDVTVELGYSVAACNAFEINESFQRTEITDKVRREDALASIPVGMDAMRPDEISLQMVTIGLRVIRSSWPYE
jgi:hypothetical protein